MFRARFFARAPGRCITAVRVKVECSNGRVAIIGFMQMKLRPNPFLQRSHAHARFYAERSMNLEALPRLAATPFFSCAAPDPPFSLEMCPSWPLYEGLQGSLAAC